MKARLGLLLLAGVGLWAQSAPPDDVFPKVPAKARMKQNPMAGDPKAELAGKKLFGQHCAECHGKDAEGGKRAPMLAGGAMMDAKPGELFWVLTNGVLSKGMPSWAKLPPQQRWQIVTFLYRMNRP
jgi:mono/diheme cytochrome c family protein